MGLDEWDEIDAWYKAEMLACYEAEAGMERWERMNPVKQPRGRRGK